MFDHLAVEVRDAQLTYGRGKKAHHALRGVNLTVPEGVIYGLLGPSGCGKTTLLNSVVGRFHLKQGIVRVFGQIPGTPDSVIPGRGVGYMPQELALYPEFTIKETLVFFGRLHQISAEVLKERMKFLLTFLDLPPKSRLVRALSGGQQRRVSFAASLIHMPPLLILDEPTVGVDPLLRQNIWNHLVELTSKQGMTVIITTHYIEEARQANMVGLMRKGRLLAEDSPTELMRKFNQPTLEESFLKLCMIDKDPNLEEELSFVTTTNNIPQNEVFYENTLRKRGSKILHPLTIPKFVITESDDILPPIDKMNQSTRNLVQFSSTPGYNIPPEEPLKHPRRRMAIPRPSNMCSDNFSNIFTLLLKNMTRLRRNPVMVLFQFALPSIQVILLCLCIGRNPFMLPMAVVNNENPISLSKYFLEKVDNYTLLQKPFMDLQSARQSVLKGDSWGVIEIGQNFTTSLMSRLSLGLGADSTVIQQSSINVYLDMTNQQIAFTIQATLLLAFQLFSKDMLATIGASPLLADLPIVIGAPIYGVTTVTFTEFIAPGVILSITYIMAVGLTTLSFVEERKNGLFDRSWVSGVTSVQVLSSHMLTQSIVLVFQVLGLLIFTFLVFEIPSRGPFIWVILMTLLQGIVGMAYGLVISALVNDESTAVMISLGSFYPNLILSGIVWPIQGMPFFVRYVSYCLPQTLATEAVRAVLSRNWGISSSVVWASFLVSFAWFAFFILTALAIFKFKS